MEKLKDRTDLIGCKFYKHNKTDKVWWLSDPETIGEFIFSFDRETIFNLFLDYPHNLTSEQKRIFDKENPFWVNFFGEK